MATKCVQTVTDQRPLLFVCVIECLHVLNNTGKWLLPTICGDWCPDGSHSATVHVYTADTNTVSSGGGERNSPAVHCIHAASCANHLCCLCSHCCGLSHVVHTGSYTRASSQYGKYPLYACMTCRSPRNLL
jgi:hypothetical protein